MVMARGAYPKSHGSGNLPHKNWFVHHLMSKPAAECVHDQIMLTWFEGPIQQVGIHFRHTKQHLEVPHPPCVSAPSVLEGAVTLPLSIVHVNGVEHGTVFLMNIQLSEADGAHNVDAILRQVSAGPELVSPHACGACGANQRHGLSIPIRNNQHLPLLAVVCGELGHRICPVLSFRYLV
jgi:hypothetical protein